jgi:hypothetical protein
MALQSAVGRGNNPFIGGSKTPNAPPPAMRGSIAPANTGVSSPEAGVAPGQPMFARNNRGSNIGIPYTRLVPLGNARFGLDGTPYTQGSDPSIHDRAYGSGTAGLKKDVITETEDLRATRIGFIHGRRRRVDAQARLDEYERGQDVNGIFNGPNNFQYMMAPGMPGTERFQKLCSLEYLQRYFQHAFKPGVHSIKIGDLELPGGMNANGFPLGNAGGPALANAANQNDWWTSGLLRMVLQHVDTQVTDAQGLLHQLGAIVKVPRVPANIATGAAAVPAVTMNLTAAGHAGAIGDLGKAFGLPDSPMLKDAAGNETPTLHQGIFVHDTSPFLRGKGITHEMVRCTKYRDAPQTLPAPSATCSPST